jgi:hypothetical protein
MPASTRSVRKAPKPLVLFLIALFLLPLAARATVFALSDHPRSFRDADWSSIGSLPPASQYPQARVLVLSGRTGGWKGVLAVHSWIVVKRENAVRWTRFDVVGWGNPVRVNGWAPDGRWFGDRPRVVVDVQGKEAERLIPKIEEAVKDYRFANAGDYHVWPGPNSNTFTAHVARQVPELGLGLPANAIGKDFLPGGALVARAPSGTGLQLSLYGIVGILVAAREGIELNVLGLSIGIDAAAPGLKLPAIGRLGLPTRIVATSSAAP